MSDEPTADEIRRVMDWQATNAGLRARERHRDQEAARQQARKALLDQITGHGPVTDAWGDQHGTDWSNLVVQFEDGVRVRIEPDPWTDPVSLDITTDKDKRP